MAKRTNGNIQPDNTAAPARRRKTNDTPATAAPKAARGRRQADPAPEAITAAADKVGQAASAPSPVVTESTRVVEVSHERIAVRAYHKFLERGGRGGDQFQDWLAAERELKSELVGASR